MKSGVIDDKCLSFLCVREIETESIYFYILLMTEVTGWSHTLLTSYFKLDSRTNG